jgi:ring-1,2-phenylacetyl-CoA epoxidase subunit PaaD
VSPTGVAARALVASIPDPELPVVSIEDLGILREVEVDAEGTVLVTVTPTYSGCPALEAIRSEIVSTLNRHGFDRVEVRTVLAPAWTTDWLSDRGRERLRAFGVAPPRPCGGCAQAAEPVCCPRCGSARSRLVSRFGSTPCKALRACLDCGEPFDHFKEH